MSFCIPHDLSARMLITHPSVVRERLIAQPSLSLSFEAYVCFCFSDPAKSTKLITESLSVVFPSMISNCLKVTVIIVWALDDVLFI